MTQKATASESSNVIQVAGNFISGASLNDCERIFKLLFAENFPKLDAIARATAEEHVAEFLALTIRKLEDRIDRIKVERLAEPDAQSTYNVAIQAVAKKGHKIDIDLLGDLLQSRLETNNTNYIDNCIEVAVEIVPKLTKEMLFLVPALHFIKTIIFTPPYNQTSIEAYYGAIFKNYMEKCQGISTSMLRTMGALGVGNYMDIMGSNTFQAYCNKYQFGSVEHAKSNFPNMYKALQLYDEKDFHKLTLTAPGQIIAIKLLHKILPQINMDSAFQH